MEREPRGEEPRYKHPSPEEPERYYTSSLVMAMLVAGVVHPLEITSTSSSSGAELWIAAVNVDDTHIDRALEDLGDKPHAMTLRLYREQVIGRYVVTGADEVPDAVHRCRDEEEQAFMFALGDIYLRGGDDE